MSRTEQESLLAHVYCASMDNTTRLLQRHAHWVDRTDTLIAEGMDPALPATFPHARCHSDLAWTEQDFRTSPLPGLASNTRSIVVILPKSMERLEMILAVLAGQCHAPVELWLVGPTRGGIRGGVTRLKQRCEAVEPLDSARHCKLYRGTLVPDRACSLEDFACSVDCHGLTVTSYPGVFSHGRLDEGTSVLLQLLEQETGFGRVLDPGCGAGGLTVALARAGAGVSGVDRSSTAVAAARASLAANGLGGELVCGDRYAGLGSFDAIWSNPPFHDGTHRTLAVAEDLIRHAPAHLEPGGTLTFVANRELPYPDVLDGVFRAWRILHETNRYRVYRAWRSRGGKPGSITG